MATTRYKGASASERLTLSTLSDNDMFQTRHLPGTVNDADKGVSKALLQALPIAVCATAAATAAKVATLAAESCPDFTLVNGRVVHIYFSAANEASTPTLNLAGTGAIPITYPNGDFVGDWPAGCTLDLMYINIVDGNTSIERWVLVSNLPVNEVTANNMQSVSAGAVSDSISYKVGEEIKTGGMFFDGSVWKDIYKKVINFGALPNATSKSVAHNISNLDQILLLYGVASNSTLQSIPLPYVYPPNVNYNVGLFRNGANIAMETRADVSGYIKSYVTIIYTKTAD